MFQALRQWMFDMLASIHYVTLQAWLHTLCLTSRLVWICHKCDRITPVLGTLVNIDFPTRDCSVVFSSLLHKYSLVMGRNTPIFNLSLYCDNYKPVKFHHCRARAVKCEVTIIFLAPLIGPCPSSNFIFCTIVMISQWQNMSTDGQTGI